MQVRCLTSFFTNNISGSQGQIIEIEDQKTVDDLVKSGYVEVIQSNQPSPEEPTSEQVEKKSTVKTKKANEGK